METYAQGRVFKRKRVWYLDYFVNGARVRESAETTNKTVAERLLVKKLNAIDEGTYTHIPKAKEVLLFDYIERYLKTYFKSDVWHESKISLFKPLKNFFGNVALHKLTPALIADYRVSRLKDRIGTRYSKVKRLVQAPTINRELTTLSALLSKAVIEGILPVNPCAKFDNGQLKFSEKGRERQRFLNGHEVKRLMDAAKPPLRQILTIAVYTGMRKGKIETLKWSDISMNDSGGTITLKTTKNGESQIVMMSPLVRKAIMSLKKHPKSDLLFPGHDPSKPWDFRKPFAEAVKKAKLDEPGKEKLVFHHLRHTFCSQLALTGNDLATIMSLSGHKSHRMVLRYIKLSPEHKLKALVNLEKKMTVPELPETKSDSNEALGLDSFPIKRPGKLMKISPAEISNSTAQSRSSRKARMVPASGTLRQVERLFEKL